MKEKYAMDPNFKDIMSALAIGRKEEPYKVRDGYLLHSHRLCVTRSLHGEVMYESHAPLYRDIEGFKLKGAKLYFYWPHMKAHIQEHVSTCMMCQKTKYDRGKQVGLVQPLPIPDAPWESSPMDFIF